ncbi:MAG: hypothetical protein LBH16_09660 [Treponema sp.]|jgi:hypothetical protein|nr:hypothetical protein [Treponema sp.]
MALFAIQSLPANEDDNLFRVFLSHLVNRHGELKNIAMPAIEAHVVPDTDNDAVYMINFKNSGDVQAFMAALKAENIPYASRPNYELQVILFSPDMIQFIWIDVLGL